jgi:hypothetical protein
MISSAVSLFMQFTFRDWIGLPVRYLQGVPIVFHAAELSRPGRAGAVVPGGRRPGGTQVRPVPRDNVVSIRQIGAHEQRA